MKPTSKPVVFFGSGPVAAASLRLLAAHCNVEAVITKPAPAHHHGPVPVIEAATDLGLPLQLAENKQQLHELFTEHHFASELGVLIDFGIIVPQPVIDYFPLGIINSHFSVLPEWRGADPITFAVLSGQQSTGVSLMLLVEKMDEGPLLAYGEFELTDTVTTPELTEGLIDLSDNLLREIVPGYVQGHVQPMPQSVTERPVSYSRKLTKDDGLLDWQKPAAVLEREIRAFIAWPKSRGYLGKVESVLTQAAVVPLTGTPGTLTIVDKSLIIYCGEQSLRIERLKPIGKKEMTGSAFLAGYKALLPL
ncbi:MAG TPA: methionyl-tRNA formyltransferase [Candidatus Saccharimonadales bacterium]|nr:methionyl-tRNA formyltransferase [Candidatus Saccharimonadales bacterium]